MGKSVSRERKRKFSRLLLVPALVAVAAVVAMVSATMLLRAATTTGGPADVANDTSTATVPPQGRTIDVVASASAFPFVQRWVTQYNNDDQSAGRVSVSYVDEGKIIPGNGDLAILGSISDAVIDNGTLYIPVAPQALAIVYNVPGFPDVSSGLKLNSTLLSLLLSGNITRWNDPSIGELNPGLALPDERIVVIHENDDSGGGGSGSPALDNYLRAPNGTAAIQWPDGSVNVPGPVELAAAVRKTPYSIGYVDFSYAVQTKMTFAAVENIAGRYVVPSTGSIDEALDNALTYPNATVIVNNNGNQTGATKPPAVDSSRLVNGSYPLVGLYYAGVPAGDDDDGAALDFVRWIIDGSGGQQTLSEVQYPPIYRNDELMAEYAEKALPA